MADKFKGFFMYFYKDCQVYKRRNSVYNYIYIIELSARTTLLFI